MSHKIMPVPAPTLAFAAGLLAALILSGCDKPGITTTVSPPPGQTIASGETAPSADAKPRQAEYRKITARQAKDMLDKNAKAILLDVRTESEFRAKHIPGSILLPYDEVEARAATMLPDKNALILIYCRSGNRSRTATLKLVSMGYTNTHDFGGIIDWPYVTESN